MKRIFLDMDGTLANFNVKNALQRFETEKGFFANLKAYKGIEEIDKLILQNNFYIISASPNSDADKDKMIWLEKYLPNLKKEHILFCRLGENKADFIENKLKIKIDNNCILLDDYTKNLTEWEKVGGKGIKRLTSIANNKSGKWKGLAIRRLIELKGILTLI